MVLRLARDASILTNSSMAPQQYETDSGQRRIRTEYFWNACQLSFTSRRPPPGPASTTLMAAYFFFFSSSMVLYTASISISSSLYRLFTCGAERMCSGYVNPKS